MIDLYAAEPSGHVPRADERFHLWSGEPTIKHHFDWGWLRRTCWVCGPNKFVSWWFFGHVQFYHGIKIDGSRTFMGWNGQLGTSGEKTNSDQYVMTTTPKEKLAFRWRTEKPGPPTWSDQGGT